jgi:pyruvate kinase
MYETPLIYNAAGAVDIIKTGSFITLDVRRGIVYSGKVNLV